MSRMLIIGCLAALLAGAAQAQPFIEGTHYHRIDGPSVPIEDRVEVIEAFAYPCGACNNFEPYMKAWEETLPDYVDVQRLPVPLQQGWELFALGFYTAQIMGVDLHDVHGAVFEAIHDQRRPIRSLEDLAEIYAENSDVTVESFVATAGTFAVDSAMRKNRSDLTRFGVRSTPTIIVQGKWRITPGSGYTSYEQLLGAIDFLIAREAAELGLDGSDSDADVEEAAETAEPDTH
ncbi:thiol:disulfide interchange protein DsbA/DsbL [Wenzhouxiangella marina]|uniref:Thiol:disulfide interchange protein DsbA n=1 Tax=Wenzhouxiangella marina TaxID=1579979 RepID=A0A0K0XZ04_9GAMM|nr:thiol:disulfide interchange protein DsbA/DsbL [Wenzhouxiangella marina]AKS42919.1 hypothetical protein WM2015_2561 [Wenzhouxiangella marina]MBB6087398.1 thiol:disulfide interchange protein DsbA [Wenzhouxiangella marina]